MKIAAVIALIALTGCVKPGMVVDFIPQHEGN